MPKSMKLMDAEGLDVCVDPGPRPVPVHTAARTVVQDTRRQRSRLNSNSGGEQMNRSWLRDHGMKASAVALSLVAVLMVGLLAGCGSSGGSASSIEKSVNKQVEKGDEIAEEAVEAGNKQAEAALEEAKTEAKEEGSQQA